MTKLEKASQQYACKAYCWAKNALPSLLAARSFKEGAKWAKENAWHDAQGDDLPEIDRNVAKNSGCKIATLDWDIRNSERWVFDWYIRNGFEEHGLGRELVKTLKEERNEQ